LDELLEYCAVMLSRNSQAVILNVNAHAVVLAEADAGFRAALAAAEVVFCDGVGVWLAARWLGAPLPARFTPPDWADRLGRLCAAAGRPVFLLGGTAEAVAGAAAVLRRMVPGLEVHTHHGYFDKAGPENEAVIAQINAARPGALLVGFGMPAQELWITAHRGRLNANLLLAVGGLFDYLSGVKRRGPRWLTDRGFEWLCRLLSEPRRLGRRYLLGLPRFAWIVARQKFGRARAA
jgi:N-acetylglucosaminyldiphosphoundecaprenol N-acetyl-beta-D-mannosaminyltransferase